MSTLDITLFGQMAVRNADQPPIRFATRKVRDLFAYLLLQRARPQSRQHLADLFWGEQEEEKARHCLNTALWRLRGKLGQPTDSDHPYLRVDAESIGFNAASDFRLDVAEFERCLALAGQLGPEAAEQQADLYQQAVDLYRGDLLPDCYDDWCLVERERLQSLYRRALRRLLTYHARRRDFDVAITCGHRLLACDPLREEVHRTLIQLYLLTNQPAEALRQYHRCEEAVRRELKSELLPETRALLPRVLAAGAAPASPIQALRAGQASADLHVVLGQFQRALDDFAGAHALLGKATAQMETVLQQLHGLRQQSLLLLATERLPQPLQPPARLEHLWQEREDRVPAAAGR